MDEMYIGIIILEYIGSYWYVLECIGHVVSCGILIQTYDVLNNNEVWMCLRMDMMISQYQSLDLRGTLSLDKPIWNLLEPWVVYCKRSHPGK